jgi:outer membrane protein assembly factor BamB
MMTRPNAWKLVSVLVGCLLLFQGAVRAADPDPVPEASITASDPDAFESGDPGNFTITVDIAPASNLTVNYTVGGTATAGTDYTALSTSATIPSGQTSVEVPVDPIADDESESDETVVLTLDSGTGYTVGSPGTATVTIQNVAVYPVATVVASDSVAIEEGLDPGVFRIQLSENAPADLDISYSVNGTAFPAGDYVDNLTGTATISSGSSSVDVDLTPVNSAENEDPKTVVLTLSEGTGYEIGFPDTATIVILESTTTNAGQRAWQYSTPAQIRSSPAVTSGGAIYVTDWGGGIHAVNSDGTELWSHDAVAGSSIKSSVTVDDDGNLYFGSLDNKFYKLKALDGSIEWTNENSTGQYRGTAAIGPDGNIYIGSYDNKLYALDSGGNQKWVFDVPVDNLHSSPAVGLDGTIYIGSDDNKLYAVNSDGTQKWAYSTGGNVMSSPAVGPDGEVYVGSNDGVVYAIESDGSEKWTYTTGGSVKSSPAIGPDGTVYVGSDDQKLYALAGEDGTVKWSVSLGAQVASSPVVGADGSVYVGSHGGKLHAYTKDGTQKWTFSLNGDVVSAPTLKPGDGTLYIGDADGLHALYTDSGGLSSTSPWPMFHQEPRHRGWVFGGESETPVATVRATDSAASEMGPDQGTFTVTLDPTPLSEVSVSIAITGSAEAGTDYNNLGTKVTFPPGTSTMELAVEPIPDSVTEGNETVILSLGAGTGYAVGSPNQATVSISDNPAFEPGSERWTFTAGGTLRSSPAVDEDGTVYVGGFDRMLYAIDADGTEKWQFAANDKIQGGPAVAEDGTIYVGSQDSNLYAVNPDGSEKWKFEGAGDQIVASPAIAKDGTVCFGSLDAKIYGVLADGTQAWSPYTTGGGIVSTPAIAADGTIYVGSKDMKLYALEPNGTLKWSFEAGGEITSSPAIGLDGTIYFGCKDNKLYALNAAGSELWSAETGDAVEGGPVVDLDGTIYVGSNDNKLYAFNGDGTKKWEYATSGSILSTPLIGANGVLYFGSGDGTIYAVDKQGNLEWQVTTGGNVYGSPNLGSGSVLYLGSYDNKLYAINTSAGTEQTDAPWAMFAHDPRNTSRAPEQVDTYSLVITAEGGEQDTVELDANETTTLTATLTENGESTPHDAFTWDVISGPTFVEDVTSGGPSSQRTYKGLVAGTATVEVTAWEGVTDTIKVDVLSSGGGTTVTEDLYEENDSLGAASLLDLGDDDQLSLPGLGLLDADYYAVNVISKATLTATINFIHDNGDLTLKILDHEGAEQAVSDSATDGESASYTNDAEETKKVYVFVYGEGGAENEYTMSLQMFRNDDAYEENDDLASAPLIIRPEDFPPESEIPASGGSRATKTISNLEALDLNDYFKIEAGLNSEVTATITYSHAAGNIDLQLLGGTNGQTVLDSSTGTTGTETVQYMTGSTESTLYLRIFPATAGEQSSYELDVELLEGLRISCEEPSTDTQVFAGGSVPISWSGFTAGTQGVRLYVDDDGDWTNGGRTLVAQDLDMPGSYDLTTAGLEVGTYWLVAYVTDGLSEVYDYAPGKIVVAPPDGNPGTQRWVRQTGGKIWGGAALTDDGALILGWGDANLYALNAVTGETLWSYSTGATVQSTPAIAPDGTIYFGSEDGVVHAVNADGTPRWTYQTGGAVRGSPAIGADGTVYVGSYDGSVYALTSAGAKKWAYATLAKVHASPAIGPNGILYAGSYDGHLYALDLATGQQAWAYQADARIHSSPAVDENGNVYFGSHDTRLYSIDLTGFKRWAYDTTGAILASPVIGADGTIYVGSWDGVLHAVNADGTQKWAESTGIDGVSAPAVSDQGIVYMGSYDDKLYAFDSTGTQLWAFNAGGDIYSAPAIGSDGTVYAGSLGKRFFAINSSSTGPAASAWPLKGRDARRSGLSPQGGPGSRTASLTVETPEADEDGTWGSFRISVDPSPGFDLRVFYSIGGTAINGTDYEQLAGSVLIPAGSTWTSVYIEPVDDDLYEGAETVALTLQSGDGYQLGDSTSGTITLFDNDSIEGSGLRGDFDGDGKSDVLLHNGPTGEVAFWFMEGAAPKSTGKVTRWAVSAGYEAVDTGDFNADGKADVLWYNASSGRAAVWLMDGTTPIDGAGLPWLAASPWTIVGAGDLDGDNKDDVILHNTSTGRVAAWLMDGKMPVRGAWVTKWIVGSGYSAAAVGDFNADGKTDIAWRRASDGRVAFWLMDGLVPVTGAQSPWTVASPWDVKGAGDLDGDGKDDLLLRNGATGRVAAWFMDGASPANGGHVTKWIPPVGLNLAATGDYDGNGTSDILWRDPSTGAVSFWLMNGLTPVTGAKSPHTAVSPWEVKD